jgi:cobalt-zinc-cadmium efflux system outer membrane protein
VHFASGVVVAETAPSFPDLFRRAEQSAPRLREIDAAVEAAAGRARQASAWLNPVAGIEVEDVLGSGPYRGSQQAQTTVTVSQPLELSGQHAARAAVGRAELHAAHVEHEQARLDFGYELAIAYAEAEAAQIRATARAEDLALLQTDVAAPARAAIVAAQADAPVAAAQAELDVARAELLQALLRLSTLAGLPETYSAVTPSLLVNSTSATAPSAATAPVTSDRLDDALTVRAAIAARNLAEAQLDSVRRNAIPAPSISIGTRRYAGDSAHAWVFGISFPLPIFDRSRGDIAAARADLVGAQAHEEQARIEARATTRAAAAQLQAALSRQTAADQAETAARAAYRLARDDYEAGRVSLNDVLAARAAVSEAQSHALDARVARVTAQAALMRLAGRIPFAE